MLRIENKRCSICKEVESDCACDWEEIGKSAKFFEWNVLAFILGIILLIITAIIFLTYASVLIDLGK